MFLNFTTHINDHFGVSKTYDRVLSQCISCGKVFQWNKNLTRHMKKCSSIQSKQTVPPNSDGIDEHKYKCHYCANVYSWEKSRQRHEKKHKHQIEETAVVGPIMFKCDYCRKEFTWEKSRKRHEITKHSVHAAETEHEFKCSHCEKSFSWQKSLTRHMKMLHKNVYWNI